MGATSRETSLRSRFTKDSAACGLSEPASPEEERAMALARWSPTWGLTRWQPERELQRLRTEMDRLFDEAFGEGGERGWRVGAWAPPVGLYDAEEAFVLK